MSLGKMAPENAFHSLNYKEIIYLDLHESIIKIVVATEIFLK